ncbi:hypothetical protein EDC04DRAFT_2691143 [Pisolithus marmoratus]|nr:hypothetical protein EDC04DRAFT_2691143 [Pisolithus marmoratus]
MQALRDVVKANYVRYIKISSCWSCQQDTYFFFQALLHAEDMQSPCRLMPVISMQNHYHLVCGKEERKNIFQCEDRFLSCLRRQCLCEAYNRYSVLGQLAATFSIHAWCSV